MGQRAAQAETEPRVEQRLAQAEVPQTASQGRPLCQVGAAAHISYGIFVMAY